MIEREQDWEQKIEMWLEGWIEFLPNGGPWLNKKSIKERF